MKKRREKHEYCQFPNCNKKVKKGAYSYCGEKHKVFCKFCNKEFELFKEYKPNCSSKECVKKQTEETCIKKYGVKNTYQKERENLEKKVCKFPNCNNVFYHSGRKFFCSNQHKVKCEYCGDEFVVKKNSINKTNCNKQECINKKREDTCMKKFGTKNPFQNEEVKEKIKKQTFEKYGVEYMNQLESVKEKIKKAHFEKYGVDCNFKSPEVQEQIKKTNIDRYGVPYATQSQEIKEKTKQTNLKKWGVEYTLQSPEVQEKIKKTNIERWGYECHLQSPEMQEKLRQISMDKYGVPYPFHNQEATEKRKKTNIEKYGVENPFASEEIKEKIKYTNLKKYGVEHNSHVPEIQEKKKKTNKERYGAENPFASEEIKDKIKEIHFNKYGVEYPSQAHIKNINDYFNFGNWCKENKGLTIQEISDYFNICTDTVCRKIEEYNVDKEYINYQNKYSGPELELKSILDANSIEYTPHDRQVIKPKEIDFLISGWNVGIEVSPDFTHNIKKVGEGYHKMKYTLAKDVGINLITLFSWYNVDKVMGLLLSNIENKEDEEVLTFEKLTEEMYTYILENTHIDLDLVNLWDKREFVVGKDINGNIKGIAVFNKKTLTLEHMFTSNMYKCKEEKYLEFYRKRRGSARLLVNNNFNIYTLNNNYKLVEEMEDIVYLYARRYINFNVGNITEQDIKADYEVKDVNAFLEQECYLLEGSGIMVYEYKKIENK